MGWQEDSSSNLLCYSLGCAALNYNMQACCMKHKAPCTV